MRRGLLLVLLLVLGPLARAADPYAVGSLLATWHDDTRNRDVPVKIYYPEAHGAPAPGKFPVVLFSHGLGGTREGYAYLGQAWAAHGYVSVHVQHLGSDDRAYKGTLQPLRKMRQAMMDPANRTNRPLDVTFALNTLTALSTDPGFALAGHLDLSEVGVAGHSFGAHTTMVLAGAAFGSGPPPVHDPRIKAAVAMSTPIIDRSLAFTSFAGVTIPVFHMTGTKDVVRLLQGPGAQPSDRRIPFDHTDHATAYLLTFEGGDHMVFSGRGVAAARPEDAAFQQRVVAGSLAFWDAYLKHDPEALRWLEGGGFAADLGALGTFEQRHPRP
jgi:predicted dienelactone hydrolase